MTIAEFRARAEVFAAGVKLASPLAAASPLLVSALIAQGNAIVSDLDGAIEATGAPLTAEEPIGHPTAMIAAVNALAAAADAHVTLHDARGLMGRAVFNLAQRAA